MGFTLFPNYEYLNSRIHVTRIAVCYVTDESQMPTLWEIDAVATTVGRGTIVSLGHSA